MMIVKFCLLGFISSVLCQVAVRIDFDSLAKKAFNGTFNDPSKLGKICRDGLGVCVPYYQCKTSAQDANGLGVLNIRLTENGECDSYFENCCDPDSVVIDEPVTLSPIPSKCGVRNSDGVGFRITGNSDGETEYGEYPWMTAILMNENIDGNDVKVYQCGGSLIHPSVVLTAAHCVNGKDSSSLIIRVGEWDSQTTKELFSHSDHDVKEIVVHNNFNQGLHNDVALLFLKNPVQMAAHINTICLPPQDAIFDHSRCFATGWGKDVFGKEGKYQVILKKIELPIVPYETCQDKLRSTRLTHRFKLHKSFVCAGGEEGKDTCEGDGGSPLFCPIKGDQGRFAQVGIVAWGVGCGESEVPGVYANVAKFRTWIDEQIALNGLDTQFYNIE